MIYCLYQHKIKPVLAKQLFTLLHSLKDNIQYNTYLRYNLAGSVQGTF